MLLLKYICRKKDLWVLKFGEVGGAAVGKPKSLYDRQFSNFCVWTSNFGVEIHIFETKFAIFITFVWVYF